MKYSKTIAKILCFLLIAMMLGMLVMQFQPFWSAEGDEASLAGYIWVPKDHKILTKYFMNVYENEFNLVFKMNNIFPVPVMVFACCILGIMICLWKSGKWFSFLLPTLGGFYGVQGYLSQRIFQLGHNWQVHLMLCGAILVIAIGGLVFSVLHKVTSQKPMP